jgi:hypothetical protein
VTLRFVHRGNISLRGICLLSLQRMTPEKPIEFRLPASELLDRVATVQFLDVK